MGAAVGGAGIDEECGGASFGARAAGTFVGGGGLWRGDRAPFESRGSTRSGGGAGRGTGDGTGGGTGADTAGGNDLDEPSGEVPRSRSHAETGESPTVAGALAGADLSAGGDLSGVDGSEEFGTSMFTPTDPSRRRW